MQNSKPEPSRCRASLMHPGHVRVHLALANRQRSWWLPLKPSSKNGTLKTQKEDTRTHTRTRGHTHTHEKAIVAEVR